MTDIAELTPKVGVSRDVLEQALNALTNCANANVPMPLSLACAQSSRQLRDALNQPDLDPYPRRPFPPEHPAVKKVKLLALIIRDERRKDGSRIKHRQVLNDLSKQAGFLTWSEYREALVSGAASPKDCRI